jgi:hypothetical protein
LPSLGTSLPAGVVASRTYTAAPGAHWAIFSTSASESNANRHTPAAYADRTCSPNLTGLLNSTSAGRTPIATSSPSSWMEAISKDAPAAARVLSTRRSGLHFIA